MGNAKFSDNSKRDAVRQIVERGYPMSGWDLSVVCRRDSSRMNDTGLGELVRRRGKVNKAFAQPSDNIFSYSGRIEKSGQQRILRGRESSVTIAAEELDSILFLRQSNSGIVHIREGGSSWMSKLRTSNLPIGMMSDLYTGIPFVGALNVNQFSDLSPLQ